MSFLTQSIALINLNVLSDNDVMSVVLTSTKDMDDFNYSHKKGPIDVSVN